MTTTTPAHLAGTARVESRRLRFGRGRAPNLAQIAALIILTIGALGMIAPFAWMFSTSLRPITESMTLPPKWLPTEWNFENYSILFSRDLPLIQYFLNSSKVAILVTLGIVLTSSFAGYAFAQIRFPGRNLLFSTLLISLMVPIQVTIVPLFIIMRLLGLIDNHLALILPGLTGAFAPGLSGAFGVFLMRQFFLTLPPELVDAAKIDGAGFWTTFWRIAMPLARPALASLAIIVFVNTWNDYFLPFIFLNSFENQLLPVGILGLRDPMHPGGAVLLAGVTLSVLPMLAIFLIGQRWIIESFVRAGIRG